MDIYTVLTWYESEPLLLFLTADLLYKSRKYCPNEISEVCVAAEQSKDKVKICDQLEKPIERLKVNEVWHQIVVKAVSISWIRTLSNPRICGCQQQYETHADTHTDMQTHILKHIQLGM